MSQSAFVCVCVALLCCGAVRADVLEGADWIRDPVFASTPVLNLYHRENETPPELFGPVNIHTLFRKEVILKEAPVSAALAVSGDDYFKLYLNDAFVTQGPAPAYSFTHPYFWLDVTSFLNQGPNCLASHVYYQGLRNRVWNSGDNRSGFILALEVVYGDGTRDRFVSDATWRCYPLDAFPGTDTIGYKTQFLEHIDMRKMPRGWRRGGFDDSQWFEPLVERQDHVFVQQITPPLQISLWKPAQHRELGNGRHWYDFGQVIVGHTRIQVHGEEGHVLTVRHGEELLEDGSVRFDMRANCRYEEYPVLSGEEDLIEFYDYRSFRYLEILDAPHTPEVWVEVRHHPFDPDATSFRSDSQLLEDTWTICRNGLVMGAQGVFVDCPSREKGQYMGDTLIAARSHLWLTADPTLTQKAIMDFTHSRYIHPGLMAVAPGNFMQEIAEYSLQFPLLVLQYYRMTGDQAVSRFAVDAVFENLFAYFAQYENEAGLLVGVNKDISKWVLVDWPANLRDDYDYEYSLVHGNTVLNAFYYGSLRAAAELQRLLGRNGVRYDTRADRLALGFAEQLVDPDTGLYLDAPGSTHSALHANAVPLAFGLSEGASVEAMLRLIREKRLSCGVYIASFVIEACFRAGDPDLGYDLLTSTDERSWSEMLRHGATTCMEAWGPDQKWNTSWLHPWSSSPIYLIAEHVLGVTPGEPGWKRIRIAPPRIRNLPAMELLAPLPVGAIRAAYSPEQGYSYMTPEGIQIDLVAPADVSIQVVAQPTEDGEYPDAAAMARADWAGRVGDALGIWVSVPRQRLYVIEEGRVGEVFVCATATAGVGARQHSEMTPPGWHRVAQKIGDGEPAGRVFRARAATADIWKSGDVVEEDLVLTRVLILDGLEQGINKGRDASGAVVDSRERFIYVHGTNDEARLGQPSSHGCIRLSNEDVIALFNRTPEGTLLFIEP